MPESITYAKGTGTNDGTYLLVIHFKDSKFAPVVHEGRYTDLLAHALHLAYTEGPNTVVSLSINRVIATYDPQATAERNVDRSFNK